MPRKIKDVTKDYLVNVALPVHGSTYTVISHKSIIDYAYQELANQGFGIVNEEYRSTLDGQIAQGIYRLQYGTDPEMNVMFAWTNSYNKQIRFKCATGGYVNANNTVMLAGELGTYARKHTGTADADVIASMQAQITDATMYYNQLVADKEVMKTIQLTSRRQAELLGVLFAEYEILTTEQASIIRQQMDKPTYFYNGGKDTLWAFYNHVTVALQQSHPRTWMEDQRMLHWVISNEFSLNQIALAANAPIEVTEALVDPLATNYGEPDNQTNLLVQIAEVTGDDSVLEPKLPVEPADYDFTQTVDYSQDTDAFSMAQLAGVKAPEDIVIHIESDEEYAQRVAEIEGQPEADVVHELYGVDNDNIETTLTNTDDIVQYTDPVGNTFELPSIQPEVAPERVKYAVDLSQEDEEIVSLDTINLNENTEIATEVVETNDFSDFDLSFGDDEESDPNGLFL